MQKLVSKTMMEKMRKAKIYRGMGLTWGEIATKLKTNRHTLQEVWRSLDMRYPPIQVRCYSCDRVMGYATQVPTHHLINTCCDPCWGVGTII